MIRYDLQCDKGHAFDAWFSNSDAYDQQVERHLVECAVCGSARIEKQIMAPGIASKANRKSESATAMVAGPVDPRAQTMLQMMREFRAHVEKTTENVGTNFAEEPPWHVLPRRAAANRAGCRARRWSAPGCCRQERPWHGPSGAAPIFRSPDLPAFR